MPVPLVEVEFVHVLLLKALKVAERRILPAANLQLPEAFFRVQRKMLGEIDRLRRFAGPEKVARKACVDVNRRKARPERFNLTQTVLCNQRIILPVDAPVGVALGLRVANKINCCHLHHRDIAQNLFFHFFRCLKRRLLIVLSVSVLLPEGIENASANCASFAPAPCAP